MSRVARTIIAALLFVSWVAVVGPTPTAGASTEQPTWWALGDSYSSGEGIPGTDAGGFGKDPDGRTCERANGSTTDNKGRAMPSAAKAWSLVAYEDLYGVQAREQNLTLVACTGAKSDAFGWQVAQAREWSKIDRPDVISFSFGGNDLGFAGVLGNCIDVPFAPLDRVNLLLGCDHSDKELRQRVEDKMGADRGAVAGALDEAAKTVAPGGHVFVLGYPHLTEESGRWPAVNKVLGSCQRITRRDAGMLRGVNGLVNQRLSQAVEAAGRRHSGVHFHWLDLPSVYETQAGRHSLCSPTGDQWLNGFTVSVTSGDRRTSRSYHPNQKGHDATGHALSTLIRNDIGADELNAPPVDTTSPPGAEDVSSEITSPEELVGAFLAAYQRGDSEAAALLAHADLPASIDLVLPPQATWTVEPCTNGTSPDGLEQYLCRVQIYEDYPDHVATLGWYEADVGLGDEHYYLRQFYCAEAGLCPGG